MKIRFFVLLFVVEFITFGASPLISSQRYWVFFTDKGGYETLSAVEQQQVIEKLLSPRALNRRQKRAVAGFSKVGWEQDLPLWQEYLDTLQRMGFRIHARSRWFNAVSGTAAPEVLDQISRLPFVRAVEPVRRRHFSREPVEPWQPGQLPKTGPQDSIIVEYGESAFQIQFHNIDSLHHKGLNGQGVVIAMFDTGFRLDHPALQHIPGQLLAEYDFVQMDSVTHNQPGDRSDQDSHGTYTLSTIGGYLPGRLVGPAFGATFLLAKTENVAVEVHQEEDNWAMAAEWAEQLGADIVSSSLGYSEFDPGQGDYTYNDMDGNTTIVTRAANFLAERGVLVVNSAGNEGGSAWHYITAPADGIWVLSVGALDKNNQVTGFSSHGPTADGRIKPDVCALGERVFCARPDNGYLYASGTSLSCPLVAGIAAQILQAFPNLDLLQLLSIFRDAGDNAALPDNVRGWGKVDARKAWLLAKGVPVQPTQSLELRPPYPNPLTRSGGLIIFPVKLPEPGLIRLTVYNILAQKIARVDYHGSQSLNLVTWDGTSFSGHPAANGIYIYRIQVDNRSVTGKIVLLR